MFVYCREELVRNVTNISNGFRRQIEKADLVLFAVEAVYKRRNPVSSESGL